MSLTEMAFSNAATASNDSPFHWKPLAIHGLHNLSNLPSNLPTPRSLSSGTHATKDVDGSPAFGWPTRHF
ncbi:hypothetical protein FRACA_370020 [Frankia canadensis]|uniref:Uncharacterized protein n=1 Tax=Frankia canadensis TaxID=1836972 RepID=A0A2I2KVP1_9ACTN|nr:hypothetical protein FRACA_370020 [Frankia canadensis]SOU57033.1 hypothetical protein FRACA_370020 [Frankia canadensis]